MDTRVLILEQSMKLFMKYGIKSVTMDDIASTMGISKKTLYLHVRNKEDLLFQVLEYRHSAEVLNTDCILVDSKDAIDALLKIAKQASERLNEISPTTIYDLKKYHPAVWAALDKKESHHVLELMHENLERGKREGLYRADIDNDFIARLNVGQVMMIMDENVFPSSKYPKSRLLLTLMIHHIRSISSPKGRLVLQERLKENNEYEKLS